MQDQMLIVYITCKSFDEADKVGRQLMSEKLCACINIFKDMDSVAFWPPKSGTFDANHESVLIAKTVSSKYSALEKRVKEIHSYDVPCIFSIKVENCSKEYYDWLVSEISND